MTMKTVMMPFSGSFKLMKKSNHCILASFVPGVLVNWWTDKCVAGLFDRTENNEKRYIDKMMHVLCIYTIATLYGSKCLVGCIF